MKKNYRVEISWQPSPLEREGLIIALSRPPSSTQTRHYLLAEMKFDSRNEGSLARKSPISPPSPFSSHDRYRLQNHSGKYIGGETRKEGRGSPFRCRKKSRVRVFTRENDALEDRRIDGGVVGYRPVNPDTESVTVERRIRKRSLGIDKIVSPAVIRFTTSNKSPEPAADVPRA